MIGDDFEPEELSPEDEAMLAEHAKEDATRALCRDCGNRAHVNTGGHCPECAAKWRARSRRPMHMLGSIGMFAALAMIAVPSAKDSEE